MLGSSKGRSGSSRIEQAIITAIVFAIINAFIGLFIRLLTTSAGRHVLGFLILYWLIVSPFIDVARHFQVKPDYGAYLAMATAAATVFLLQRLFNRRGKPKPVKEDEFDYDPSRQ